MPTLTQSAPALISASVASGVATLPATSCASGYFSLTRRTQRMMLALWPWALSSTSTSTPASSSAPVRSRISFVTPMAAAHSSRPAPSLAELGYFMTFSMSLIVMRPRRRFSLSTIGSFSMRWWRRISLASSSVVPIWPVTSPLLVMTSAILRLRSFSNFMSRLVMMPTSLSSSSTTGTPEMRYFAISASASPSVLSGVSEKGLVMTPFSERLTRSTCSACMSIDMFLWMTPMPPSRAMAMAMRYSVTVSMAALMTGMFNLTLFVRQVERSTSAGSTSLSAGTSSTSSKVSPSPMIRLAYSSEKSIGITP